jgi:predicted small lipoprotein YifL
MTPMRSVLWLLVVSSLAGCGLLVDWGPGCCADD